MKKFLLTLFAIVFTFQTCVILILYSQMQDLQWKTRINQNTIEQKIEESLSNQDDIKKEIKLLYSSVSESRRLTTNAVAEIQKIKDQAQTQTQYQYANNSTPLSYMKLQKTEKELAEIPPQKTDTNYAETHAYIPIPCSSDNSDIKRELKNIKSELSTISDEISENQSRERMKFLFQPYSR